MKVEFRQRHQHGLAAASLSGPPNGQKKEEVDMNPDFILKLVTAILESGQENEYVEARLEQIWDRLTVLPDTVFPTLNRKRQCYIVLMILMGVAADDQDYPFYA